MASAAAVIAAPALARAATAGRIDVHHHIFPREVMELQEKLNPAWGRLRTPEPLKVWTPQAMLADMDANSIAAVVASNPGPGAWYGDNDGARRIMRAWNEYAARVKAEHPSRFGFFAMIALPDVEGSLKEIAYAFDVLKADGVALYTSYEGEYPGDKKFAPVFEELDRRSAAVFFHPLVAKCCGNVVPGIPTNAYELPFDTTRAIASLLFSGTLAQRRNIKFIFSHAGGALPALAGRIDMLTKDNKRLREATPNGVEAELKRLYVDTAGAGTAGAMTAAFSLLPAKQILYGSDFPYLSHAENLALLNARDLSAGVASGIERENARMLFPKLG
ncbi:MAG: amidohydrolase [Beijerinckiaceae bacterium]|nr:amidohydrolase [Beijerinckiaceae bacterium]